MTTIGRGECNVWLTVCRQVADCGFACHSKSHTCLLRFIAWICQYGGLSTMKKILLATAALAALTTAPAMAADLARPAPVYVPAAPVIVPVWSWTGFYVGANAGGGWQSTDYTTNLTNCNVLGVCGAGLVFGVPANQALGSALGTGSGGRSSGFIGGFQAGCNFKFRVCPGH